MDVGSASVLAGARVTAGSGAGLITLARPAQRQRSRSGMTAAMIALRFLDCCLNICITFLSPFSSRPPPTQVRSG